MDKQAQAISNDLGTLAEEEVSAARKRFTAALDTGKQIVGRVKRKAVAGAKATDEAMHEHPYQAIGVALAAGALLGYLISRFTCNRD